MQNQINCRAAYLVISDLVNKTKTVLKCQGLKSIKIIFVNILKCIYILSRLFANPFLPFSSFFKILFLITYFFIMFYC